MKHWWNDIDGDKPKHTEITDPTWTDMGSNLDFCNKKPAYIRLKPDCELSIVACAVPDN
jgi:hypothetical protein